ncbi:zinc finger protein 593-like [Saccoglossus kowalevskii]|uniref:Zinc finger protein 593-like n=1 Tax=Saccoglossus kowalevskii TaxID=10224 RepID=A0ABM0H1G3_SACKO|nr:PREDICTED: zinc finger protein 593-like [Saccoglossus kowalevskii]
MGRLKRKKYHKGNTYVQKMFRTRRKTKDIDQIHEDMKPEKADKLLNQEVDHDLPGAGQNYCLHCAKHFIDLQAMTSHFKSRNHKRRLRALTEEPYSQKEADAAAGMGSYYAPQKLKKVKTQPIVKKDMDTTED